MTRGTFSLALRITVILLPLLAGMTAISWAIGQMTPIQTAQIAYVSDHDGLPDLFLLDAPRQLTHRLTWGEASNREPAWSPDGDWLVFTSNRDHADEIYLLHVYTGEMRQLTHKQVVDDSPAWSPDGSQIAFASTRSGNTDIYVIDLSTGATTQITTNPGWDSDPAWSPDSQQLVFVSNRAGYGALYIIPATGGEARQITWNSGWHLNPAWSPDGRWITFDSAGVETADIFLLDTTCLQSGGDCQQATWQLTRNDRVDSEPAWSPDSQQIVYYSGTSGLRYNLMVIPVTCYRASSGCETAAQAITDERFVDWSPAWRP